jgi:filamentous hemagglutinin family protein
MPPAPQPLLAFSPLRPLQVVPLRQTWVELCLGGSMLLGSSAIGPAVAQTQPVIPDGTLGTRVTPQGIGIPTEITGGTQRGAVLFHSFQSFGVEALQRVEFSPPPGVSDIFSRVTGSQSSQILGTLAVQGPANLFLLNPNGILLGPNAQLDIMGQLTLSTASSVRFRDGGEFSATSPQAPPLVVNVTPGLQWGPRSPGSTLRTEGQLQSAGKLQLIADRIDLGDIQAPTLQAFADGDLSYGNLNINGSPYVLLQRPLLQLQAGGQIQGRGAVDALAWGQLQVTMQAGGDLNLRKVFAGGGDIALTSGGTINTNGEALDIYGFPTPGSIVLQAQGDILAGDILASGDFVGGRVSLTGNQITAKQVQTYTGRGNGGAIQLNARSGIRLEGDLDSRSLSSDRRRTPGDSGTIQIANLQGEVLLPRILTTAGNGDGGNVSIQQGDGPVTIGYLFTRSEMGGNGGNVQMRGDRSQFSITKLHTFAEFGQGGNVDLALTQGNVRLGELFSFSANGDRGGDVAVLAQGGQIALLPGNPDARVSLNSEPVPQGLLLSGSFGPPSPTGRGGNIRLEAQGDLRVGSMISRASAQGGDITLIARQGSLLGILESGAKFEDANLVTSSEGRSGQVVVETGGAVQLGGIFTSSGEQQAGDVNLRAGGPIETGSILTVGSTGSGNITLTTPDTVQFVPREHRFNGDRLELFSVMVSSDTMGRGRGGDIRINAGNILLQDGAQISSTAQGQGDGGNISLVARNRLVIQGRSPQDLNIVSSETFNSIAGMASGTLQAGQYLPSARLKRGQPSGQTPSGVFAQTLANSTGNAGNLAIQAQQVLLQDSGSLGTTTFGRGYAGQIQIQTSNLVVDNGNIFGGIGGPQGRTTPTDAQIQIQAQTVDLTRGGLIETSTFGRGDAGQIQIQADTINLAGNNGLRNSAIRTASGDPEVRAPILGSGNTILLNTRVLNLTEGAELSAETYTSGRGGAIVINQADAIRLSQGAQLLTSAYSNGDAGSVKINQAGEVSLQDGAKIQVDSRGYGAAGNLEISANRLLLQQGSELSASSTLASTGGNIALDISEYLRMQGQGAAGSRITTSSTGQGDAGNIRITTPFMLAEAGGNNDIFANARDGRGGNITLQTNGVYGFRLRDRRDIQSFAGGGAAFDPQTVFPKSNDIIAISQTGRPSLDGTVTLEGALTDPSRGLTPLPTDLVDHSQQIDQRCQRPTAPSSFAVTGRGGLPYDPLRQPLGDSYSPVEGELVQTSGPVAIAPPEAPVEMERWQRGPQGEVQLVAAQKRPPQLQPPDCQRVSHTTKP